VNKFLLLIKASMLIRLRWARRHVYAWMVLGPLVIGGTYATATRLTENLALVQLSHVSSLGLASLISACLMALALSRSTIELYHIRRPESYFDALPVSSDTLLHAAMVNRLTRAAATGLLVVVFRSIIGKEVMIEPSILPALVSFVVVLALSEVFAALNWVHRGHTKDSGAAARALAVLLVSAVLSGLLLVIVLTEGAWVRPARPWPLAAAAWSLALYVMIRRLHRRWRSPDIEYAKRLHASGRWNLFKLSAFKRRFGPSVAAQLLRDLQLTLRVFSSAVYVVLAIALLLHAALFAILRTELLPPPYEIRGWFDQTWQPWAMATKLACVVVVAALGALVPVLLAYELPHFWMERAMGVKGLDIWEAKLWYARLVSLPAPATVWLVALSTGEAAPDYALPLLAECAWLWWLSSSVIGALSFEMPERPALAILIMTMMSLAAGAFGALLWPFGIIIYFQAMHSLADRGRQMARYYLITEGD
jgi:hypothetical protein